MPVPASHLDAIEWCSGGVLRPTGDYPSTVSLVGTQPAARISITPGRDWKDEFENMRSPNQPPALCLAKLLHAERAILAPSVIFRDRIDGQWPSTEDAILTILTEFVDFACAVRYTACAR
jgi:hypothetical protein